MRDRHIIWDILVVLLLLTLVLFNGMALMQNGRLERLNYATYLRMQDLQSNGGGGGGGGTVVRTESSQTTEVKDTGPHSPSYFDGSTNPKFTRGDENADDGDALVINEISEPNSLNPLIDNDATSSDIFEWCVDKLADRMFEDISKFEPRLATGWEKAMTCRAIASKKNAKELAAKLNEAISAEERKKLKIGKIEAESDEVLRIDLFDTASDYREPVAKALGDGAVDKQHWLYVGFEGTNFTDGTKVDAKTVGDRVRKAITDSGFKGRFLPDWERESSVVVKVLGDRDAAEKALRAYVASDAAIGEITDPKSVTGKTKQKIVVVDLIEHYVFEEKPIFDFVLRKGVKWHDGAPFTGKDVVFSFKAMMDPDIESSSIRNYYQDCESVELVDNDLYKVRFTWKKPYFNSLAMSTEMYLFPEHLRRYARGKDFNESPNNQKLFGMGAYVFDHWDRQQQMVLVRNENYWGKKPHFKKVIIKFVKDMTVSLSMLKAGELDVHPMTKAQAALALQDESFKEKYGIEVSIANQFAYCGWNMRRNLFKDEKTRRALTMLVDRQRICDKIMRGFAIPIDIPAHPKNPTWPPNADQLKIPFDVEAAKKLLAEDGWKDTDGDNILDRDFGDGKRTPFKFTLKLHISSPELESIANLMQDSLAQAGIVMTIQNLEWSVLLQSIERLNFDATIMSWRLGTSDDPYQLWHSSQTGEKASNHCGFIDKEVDRLIESGRCELDPAKRVPMFQEVYSRISQSQPYLCLFVAKRTVAYDNRIKNVVYTLQGKDIMRWWVPRARQKTK